MALAASFSSLVCSVVPTSRTLLKDLSEESICSWRKISISKNVGDVKHDHAVLARTKANPRSNQRQIRLRMLRRRTRPRPLPRVALGVFLRLYVEPDEPFAQQSAAMP